RIYLHTSDHLSEKKRATIAAFTRSGTCPECTGERLNAAARAAQVHGHSIGELARLELTDLAEVVGEIHEPQVAPVTQALIERLEAMVTVGLGYLTLSRATSTLSGGESQRVKMVKHLGSSLTTMTYVVDEPTVGLHTVDVAAMLELLLRLRDAGNNVIVVEHDPEVMGCADQLIELGPGAGSAGGRLVYQGRWSGLLSADTPTGRALRRTPSTPGAARTPTGWLTVRDAERNNLQHLTVQIPTGVLTVLTGVAGELVAQHGASVVDQRPVAANRRSTPITYTGIAAPIRSLFARTNGVPARLFSANSDGGCPDCQGLGVIYTDLAFLDGQQLPC